MQAEILTIPSPARYNLKYGKYLICIENIGPRGYFYAYYNTTDKKYNPDRIAREFGKETADELEQGLKILREQADGCGNRCEIQAPML